MSKPAQADFKELLAFYRQMLLIRRFEEKTAEMYQRARIGGYCHLNLGEEATCVGLCAGMQPNDYLFTNYREHGYALARGIDPGRVMAVIWSLSLIFISCDCWRNAVRDLLLLWPGVFPPTTPDARATQLLW